ncbi:hypothetical protein ES703_15679 [subsurface metagenome]
MQKLVSLFLDGARKKVYDFRQVTVCDLPIFIKVLWIKESSVVVGDEELFFRDFEMLTAVVDETEEFFKPFQKFASDYVKVAEIGCLSLFTCLLSDFMT